MVQGAVETSDETSCELQPHSCGKGEDLLLSRRPIEHEFREVLGMAWTRSQHLVWLVCGGVAVDFRAARYRASVLREQPLQFGKLEVMDLEQSETAPEDLTERPLIPRCIGRRWRGAGELEGR